MKPLRILLTLLLLFLTSGGLAPWQSAAAVRQPARGRHAMVASSHKAASAIGVEVLKQGGNAVDAAVAVALALAVAYPYAGNLGGGGFMLIRMADGRATAIDYRETAPAAATRNMYLDASGKLVPEASTVGYKAAGVPGTPAGLALALEKYGTKSWSDLVEPARRLAAEGYEVDVREQRRLEGEMGAIFERFPESRRIFLRDGQFYREGERLRQPELAATLARMQREGFREFYEGETARLIAADMKANGGLITLEDLKNYRPTERIPLKGRYRGYEILTMPPPSSGGIALLQMLQMLEHFDLREAGFGSSTVLHLEVEAMRRAFADRAEHLGDTDFVEVPVEALLARKYTDRLAATIDLQKASTSQQIQAGKPLASEPHETTHFTIVDLAGNVVSNTYTLNGAYGSGVVAKGTGVLLNNEMDDFAASPGKPNLYGLIQGEKNAIAPGKRPLSSMTPTIVLDEGRLWFAVGSPGGPTIINTVLQTLLNVIDFQMDIQTALDAPRIHHQWMPDEIVYEPTFLSPDVQGALKARGHIFTAKPRLIGDAQAIAIEKGTQIRLGASDGRQLGEALGY